MMKKKQSLALAFFMRLVVCGPNVSLIIFFMDTVDLSVADHSETSLEDTFRLRSDGDWVSLWHQESFPRCREDILKHLYWACSKDIYKLTTRSLGEDHQSPVMLPQSAKSFLRFRRNIRRRSSITNECCNASGCTWEEYAEYCPANKRSRKYR